MVKRWIILALLGILLSQSAVFADDEIEEEGITNLEAVIQASSESVEEPVLNSRAAIVYDRKTGLTLFGKNENTKRPMASTTKIMTAVIVLENADLSQVVEVSKKAAGTGGSRLGLSAGAKITIHDLLYGLMLCSGNDAAVALAETVGGSIEGFAEKMNQKAAELGLENTHFVTPHGLDQPQHYTTAYELAKLTDYALKIEKFSQIVGTKNTTITINGNPKQIHNTNELLGYLTGVYGVKTGFTNGANRCLVTAAKRNDMDIICVVLGADTKKFRTTDSIKLIEYTFKTYKMVPIEEIVKQNVENWIAENHIKVDKGVAHEIKIGMSPIPYQEYPIKQWKTEDIYIQIENVSEVKAPIKKGEKIGSIYVLNETQMLFTVDLLVEENVKKKQIQDYFWEMLSNMCLFYEFM